MNSMLALPICSKTSLEVLLREILHVVVVIVAWGHVVYLYTEEEYPWGLEKNWHFAFIRWVDITMHWASGCLYRSRLHLFMGVWHIMKLPSIVNSFDDAIPGIGEKLLYFTPCNALDTTSYVSTAMTSTSLNAKVVGSLLYGLLKWHGFYY
ncbi:uncharacterized protein LOC106176588 [Lingula anatina]|uniref:Uncharacterized protein LOC106176588 n=1 Tax=Lingula anatina TaxID=7574 RepID=A0A1S3JVT3_LINAN|nr:uncharacterized protein LOC106176588 [Lingula anatina]|eukprot:XP_013414515.1 uncharacterized protein LOC106176588 [Lingula anatina]